MKDMQKMKKEVLNHENVVNIARTEEKEKGSRIINLPTNFYVSSVKLNVNGWEKYGASYDLLEPASSFFSYEKIDEKLHEMLEIIEKAKVKGKEFLDMKKRIEEMKNVYYEQIQVLQTTHRSLRINYYAEATKVELPRILGMRLRLDVKPGRVNVSAIIEGYYAPNFNNEIQKQKDVLDKLIKLAGEKLAAEAKLAAEPKLVAEATLKKPGKISAPIPPTIMTKPLSQEVPGMLVIKNPDVEFVSKDSEIALYKPITTTMPKHSPDPLAMTSIITKGLTDFASAGKDMYVAYQESKRAAQETERAKLAVLQKNTEVIFKTMTGLSKQLKAIVQSQNEVIKSATDKFLKLCDELKDISPVKLAELREKRINQEASLQKVDISYHKTQAAEMFKLMREDKDNKEFYQSQYKEHQAAIREAEAKIDTTKIDAVFEKEKTSFLNAIEASQKRFMKLLKDLKLSDKIFERVGEIQYEMSQLAKAYILGPTHLKIEGAKLTSTSEKAKLDSTKELSEKLADDEIITLEDGKLLAIEAPKAPTVKMARKPRTILQQDYKAVDDFTPTDEDKATIKENKDYEKYAERACSFSKGAKFKLKLFDGAELPKDSWIKARQEDNKKVLVPTAWLKKCS